jgi:hypothetical protein
MRLICWIIAFFREGYYKKGEIVLVKAGSSKTFVLLREDSVFPTLFYRQIWDGSGDLEYDDWNGGTSRYIRNLAGKTPKVRLATWMERRKLEGYKQWLKDQKNP